MTVFLVGAADLHRYTQIEWEKITTNYKATVVKAEKENEKAEKEKEASKSQFSILQSEKTSLIKALEDAKAARDEAITTTDSLKSE